MEEYYSLNLLLNLQSIYQNILKKLHVGSQLI